MCIVEAYPDNWGSDNSCHGDNDYLHLMSDHLNYVCHHAINYQISNCLLVFRWWVKGGFPHKWGDVGKIFEINWVTLGMWWEYPGWTLDPSPQSFACFHFSLSCYHKRQKENRTNRERQNANCKKFHFIIRPKSVSCVLLSTAIYMACKSRVNHLHLHIWTFYSYTYILVMCVYIFTLRWGQCKYLSNTLTWFCVNVWECVCVYITYP
jgi:hypothetical protein